MVDMNPIRRGLDKIRGRIQGKKEKPKEPTRLVRLFRQTQQRKQDQTSRRIESAVREAKKSDRVEGAVGLYFDHITQKTLDAVEKRFPETLKVLFEVSQGLVNGDCGKELQEHAMSLSDSLFTPRALLTFLMVSANEKVEILEGTNLAKLRNLTEGLSRSNKERLLCELAAGEPPEVEACRKEISSLAATLPPHRSELVAIERLFRGYISKLSSPSEVTVDLLLEKDQGAASIKAAKQLKTPTERTKSLDSIVKNLIGKQKVNEAIKLVRNIKVETERTKPLISLIDRVLSSRSSEVDRWIESGEVDTLIEQACVLKDIKERHRMLKNIASGLVKQNQIEKAMEVVRLIKDPDVQDLTLSSIVNILVTKRQFDQAERVAFTVTSPEYRQDAIDYIVKGFLDDKAFDKTIQFVEGLKDPVEKTHAARILVSGLLAVHDKAAAEEVREKFSLA